MFFKDDKDCVDTRLERNVKRLSGWVKLDQKPEPPPGEQREREREREVLRGGPTPKGRA